jgi:hypothetical protein
VEEMRNTSTKKLRSENLKGWDQDIDGRLMFEWILKNGTLETGFSWLRIGISVGSYEHGNETSCSITGGEFLG